MDEPLNDDAERKRLQRLRERGEHSPIQITNSPAARWQRDHRERQRGERSPVRLSEKPEAKRKRVERERQSGILPPDLSLHYCGKMKKRCRSCGAGHYKTELFSCCSGGKLYRLPTKHPPKYLYWLMTSNSKKALKFRANLVRYNQLFALACRKYKRAPQPDGHGAPVVKLKGGTCVVVSGVKAPKYNGEENEPFCGVYFTYDPKIASELRMDNRLQGEFVDEKIVRRLSREFARMNELAKNYFHLGEVIDEQDLDDDALRAFRVQLVAKYQAPEGTTSTHPGRLNLPQEKEFAVHLCEVDSDDQPLERNVLLIYGRFDEKHPPYAVAPFSPFVIFP